MPNGARNGMLATFFVLGMAFMGMLFFMIFPDVFSPVAFHERPVFEPQQSVRVDAPTPAETPTPLPPTPPTELVAREENSRKSEPALALKRPQLETPIPEPNSLSLAPPMPPEPKVEPVANRPSNPNGHSIVVQQTTRGRLLFGKVALLSKPPQETSIPLDPTCGSLNDSPKTTHFYNVGEGGALGDVVIVVSGDLSHGPWPQTREPLVIAARGCSFEPYVSAAQVGQRVIFENLDPIMHNFHMTSKRLESNKAVFPKDRPINFAFENPEDFIRVRCEVHGWMFAYVTVVEHPYFAVTGRDGKFQIQGLPDGKFTVTATHRKAGQVARKIVITDDRPMELNFGFNVPSQIAERK